MSLKVEKISIKTSLPSQYGFNLSFRDIIESRVVIKITQMIRISGKQTSQSVSSIKHSFAKNTAQHADSLWKRVEYQKIYPAQHPFLVLPQSHPKSPPATAHHDFSFCPLSIITSFHRNRSCLPKLLYVFGMGSCPLYPQWCQTILRIPNMGGDG